MKILLKKLLIVVLLLIIAFESIPEKVASATTLDYQVVVQAGDGYGSNYPQIVNSPTTFAMAGLNTYIHGIFALFTGITIPVGATINVAYLTYYENSSWPNGTSAFKTSLWAEDSATPAIPTTWSDMIGKATTTYNINHDNDPGVDGWYNTASIVGIVQELVNSYNYSGGRSMQFIFMDRGSSAGNYFRIRTYEYVASSAIKLHIEYSMPSSGSKKKSFIF